MALSATVIGDVDDPERAFRLLIDGYDMEPWYSDQRSPCFNVPEPGSVLSSPLRSAVYGYTIVVRFGTAPGADTVVTTSRYMSVVPSELLDILSRVVTVL